MSYTKGEWEMVENSWAITTIYAPGRQGIVCELTLSESVTEETQEEAEQLQRANAKLISAAPDLLEVLKEVVDCGSLVPCTPSPEAGACYLIDANIIDLAKAAIKKAEL